MYKHSLPQILILSIFVGVVPVLSQAPEAPSPPTTTAVAQRRDDARIARGHQAPATEVMEEGESRPLVPPAAVSEEKWLALKASYREVAGRVPAARRSTKALADSLAARGLTINTDLAASLESMNVAMAHADTAIGRSSYVEAREAIESAGAYATRVLQHFGC